MTCRWPLREEAGDDESNNRIFACSEFRTLAGYLRLVPYAQAADLRWCSSALLGERDGRGDARCSSSTPSTISSRTATTERASAAFSRSMCCVIAGADGVELHLGLRGPCKVGAFYRPRPEAARHLTHLQTLSFSYFNQNSRRLCPCARHVRHRPHREHARLGPDGGRVVHRVSAVCDRDDVRPELEAGARRDA